jgi:hypothetical protein
VSDPEDAVPWREPAVGVYWGASDRSLSGVELLRGEVDGRIPMSPVGHLTGLRAMDGAVGAATFSMPATPLLVGSSLIAGGHAGDPGGFAAAIVSALPPQTGLVTSELSLSFLRPVRAGGDLVAYGTLVHGGGHWGCRMCGSSTEMGDWSQTGTRCASSGLFHRRVANRRRPKHMSRLPPFGPLRDWTLSSAPRSARFSVKRCGIG